MTLYVYKVGTDVPVLTIEDVVSYTDDEARTEDGTIYGPFAEGVELSSKENCTEALRAAWRAGHSSPEDRICDLEELVASLLFGGDAV